MPSVKLKKVVKTRLYFITWSRDEASVEWSIAYFIVTIDIIQRCMSETLVMLRARQLQLQSLIYFGVN